jgi:hypothetical protein
VKIGDLVRLQFQGNGQPGIGVIYEVDKSSGYDGESVFKCLWDVPMWNCIGWHERELVVIDESH